MTTSPSPWIKTIQIDPPSLTDNTADADRLINSLKPLLPGKTRSILIDIDLLRRLPGRLRQNDFAVRCLLCKDRHHWVLQEITSAQDSSVMAGVAIDLGTTRVALRILDLDGGKTLAEAAFDNPQLASGPDVLARIQYADKPQGLTELQQLIISELNCRIAGLADSCRIAADNLFAVSVAGNTAMTHLFMGLTPRWIIREPYTPAVNTPPIMRALDLGLQVNTAARVFVFPNVGSYCGGDLIAGILFSGLHQKSETAMLVDVGTNAEVVLGNRSWLIACAGAAGPALEGSVTRMGMTAGPGVIDKIRIDPQSRTWALHTIDELPPKGICGSGLIDLAAQLFEAGLLDIRGQFVPTACGSRLKTIDGRLHLVVAPANETGGTELTISQTDLDSLVRSKAAMYTILETLSETVGVKFDELQVFYVAGTFGSFIDPRSAISIGMLPDLPIDRFRAIGNSSLEGAALALTSPDRLSEIDMIRDHITYLELNVNQDFMNRFNAARFLPHTDAGRFPSVTVEKK